MPQSGNGGLPSIPYILKNPVHLKKYKNIDIYFL
jgi:hypothetical protein